MGVRGYTLSCDWDGDGDHDGTREDLTSQLLDDPTLHTTCGRDTAQTQSPTTSGKMSFALDNRDRAFSPENTASPIAGLVLPGRAVRLQYGTDLASDAFERSVTSGWGSADLGGTYLVTGGSASDYSVASGTGQHSLGSTNVARRSVLPDTYTDVDAVVSITIPVLPTGAPIDAGILLAYTGTSNHYIFRLRADTDQTITAGILKNVGGSISIIESVAVDSLTHTAGASYRMHAQLQEGALHLSIWAAGDTEPDEWQVEAEDATFTSGRAGIRSILGSANTNTPPVVIEYDSLTVTTPTRVLFDGVLDDFTIAADSASKAFTAECLDGWGRPGAEKLSTPVHAGVRAGQAIHLVLDAIGWAGRRDIDDGATVIAWWWAEDEDAASAVERIVDSEGPPSIAYVDGGTFTFRDRHHRILRSKSTTVQGTFTHSVPGGSGPAGSCKILRGAEYDHGLRNIINTVSATVEERRPAQAEAQVWTSEDVISLTDGETVAVEAQASDPFVAAVVPVAGTDYTLMSGTVTTWLSRDSGQAATIFVKATGGPAQIVSMALRAVPLTVVNTRKVVEEDPTSISVHGRRTWSRTAPWANIHDTRAIAARIVATYTTSRPSIAFTVANVNAAHTAQILSRRVGDRVRIINDELGVDDEFWIERLEHNIRKLGAIHKATLGCQIAGPEQAANAFTFDLAAHGFDDGVYAYTGIDDPANIFLFDGDTGHRFNEGVLAT